MKATLQQLLQQRILILDGAMGTMVQRYRLSEEDYRGNTFKNWSTLVKGNNDLLSLTQPRIIKEIHKQYLAAGADIIETNTFNAQSISQADYNMQHLVYEMNLAAAKCAKEAIQEFNNTLSKPKPLFVAGAIGPMNKTLSLSPDVNHPAYRSITFQQAAKAYYEQVKALVEAQVDALLIETIFDTLNAKAAIYAIKQYFHSIQKPPLPVMISGTITDASGRTLSGQTLEAFYISVMHARPLSIGLNCALGAKEMQPYIEQLARIASCYVSAYPNAGLPNAMGQYDEQPEETSYYIEKWAKEGWLNIAGGCCGTTPEHIQKIAQKVKNITPRVLPSFKKENNEQVLL
jgi:5-methyltetrahydrofolate--homocysteine methyltransferase